MGGEGKSPSGRPLERRQFIRLPVSLPVIGRAVRFAGEDLRGGVRNIGAGGLMAELPMEVVPSSAVTLVFQTQRGTLEVAGQVMWTAVTEGMIRHGVAFADPNRQAFAVALFLCESSWGEGVGV